jgi:hypothetical protein
MAKRKYQFKPDAQGTGIMSKLYLTRLQRMSLLKWTLYGALLLVASVLQDVVFCRFSLWGATTDLVPCVILIVALLQETESGSIFSLVASALYLFSGSSPGVYVIAFLTFLGVMLNVFRQSYLRKSFGSTVLCAIAGILIYELAVFLMGLFLEQTLPGRFGIFLLTGILSALTVPILYPALAAISKIGGESWKE